MEALKIEGQFNFPSVEFDSSTGLLKIVGRSIPENPVKFYQPIENWICDFIKTNPSKITFYLYLDYLNTHSTECVLILMKILQSYFDESKSDVNIIWHYDEDDEDMQSLGEDLASIISIPFEYVVINE